MNNVINISAFSQRQVASSSNRTEKTSHAKTAAFNETVAPHWQKAVVAQLNDLCSLPAGWDGYRADPVRFENAYFALNVLQSICSFNTPSPTIVPGFNGDLQIEWHRPADIIEIHIHAPNRVTAWRQNNTQEEGEEISVTSSFAQLASWAERLSELAGANKPAAA
jgi:hypothetical protein